MTDNTIVVVDTDVVVIEGGSTTVVLENPNAPVTIIDDVTLVIATEITDTVVLDGLNDVVTLMEEQQVSVVSVGEQGPPGRDGTNGSGALDFNFAYGDATPAVLMTVPAGKLIYRVGLHIKEPFNGVGASVTIGDAVDTDRLMSTTQNDLTQVGSNETSPAYAYGTDTQITLSVVAGAGASTGAGLISLYIEQ
jgi:hypothetical protein